MERAYKFRLYPNSEQEILINKTFGCTRLVYNHFLNERIEHYKQTGKSLTYNSCSNLLTELKKQKLFLKEVDKFSLQNSLRDLDNAFKNFFNGSGYPKFKSKKHHHHSYRTNLTNNNIEVFEKHIKLPKLGRIKRKGYKNIEGKIISATISKSSTGKYFCSLVVEKEIIPLPKANSNIGIDLGIKAFATLSNGEIITNPKTLYRYEAKLKREQRKLSKKVKGSKNFNKQRLKVSKLHEKVANIRQDFLHKVTTKLINENQVICLEDLNVKGMLKNHHLAKTISDVGLNKFLTYLSYKADWHGRTIIQVDRFYPSSQLCSKCGYKNPLVKNLGIREWECPSCGTVHDRDINASINILQEGLRIYKEQNSVA
ncbi:IS200/IS605 family element transposase accessory protein TnpB [Clostridium cochlearium]|uniref:IS200/IS605 family element RNA-guided endonuclease TnpB n=1 Tax=Clostridium cochlearium TaxID=1494 RepID=UPI001459F301|nr:IS200/IS605 family element RNA-guided endonuclease TnpB [Clostridium cochlearium]NME95351.1 IS200/IS605 family element transposase accessory protein TnpB [Clostridium cochlearium]